MASRKPLVLGSNGKPQQLQSGDTLNASVSQVSVVSLSNANASSITLGMVVYISGADACDLARANASGTTAPVGLVADASISAAASGLVQTAGILSSANWTAVIGSTTLTTGSTYFLSAATAGLLTATAPSTTGQYVVIVGQAISTTEMNIKIGVEILL